MYKILCIYTFVHADQINTSIRCVTATNDDAVAAHDSLVVNDIPELLWWVVQGFSVFDRLFLFTNLIFRDHQNMPV